MPSSQVHILHASSGDYTCAPPPPTKKSSDDHCCFENPLCASYVCGASIIDSKVQTYAESNTTWCNIIAASGDIDYTSRFNSTCGGTAMNCIYGREYFASGASPVAATLGGGGGEGQLQLMGTLGLAWMMGSWVMGWLGRH
ncbi:hypothetical protein IAT40_001416 [Kwoniella sp. CBS 6097]